MSFTSLKWITGESALKMCFRRIQRVCIVDDIVEKHGGEIAVERRPGQGTRFTIRFPILSE